MDFAFILDPLPKLKAYKDSSVAMMRALAARGHRVFALEPADLFWDAAAASGARRAAHAPPDDARLVPRRASPRSGPSRVSPRC